MVQRSATSLRDKTLKVYSRAQVVESYGGTSQLMPCELLLFQKYLRPGMAILDLGVGGGRTSQYLSSLSEDYVGIDFSPAMIEESRRRFPNLDFRVMDASDLSTFSEASLDAIVFSFNGIDCLVPATARARCIDECHRILKGNGVLILSSHNPHCIPFGIVWGAIEAKVASLTDRLLGQGSQLGSVLRVVLFAAVLSYVRLQQSWTALRRMLSSAFWRGRGYLLDPVHGGLVTYMATPTKIKKEFSAAGFELLVTLGGGHPKELGRFRTAWYYYVFVKAQHEGKNPR